MISVVIPAYNAEHTLAGCLQALKTQTLAPDEVIVVDDGSTDRTAQVARSFNVTLINQPNRGPAAARNAGVAAACGEIVLFTDADCEPDRRWAERMAEPFNDPGVDGVKGVYRTRQREPAARLAQFEFEGRYLLLSRFETIDFVDGHAAAFRRKTFLEINGFDPAFPEANNEDVDLSYRLAAAGRRMVFQPEAIVYHHHPDTFRKYFQVKVRRGYWRMIVYRQHPGKAIRDTYTPQSLKLQILFVYLAAAALVLGLLDPALLWGLGLPAAGFLASAAPFVARVRRSQPQLTLLAIWFVFIRATAFSIGILAGLAGMFVFRHQIKP